MYNHSPPTLSFLITSLKLPPIPVLRAVRAGGVVWGQGPRLPPLSEEGSALPPALVVSLLSTPFSPRCGPSSFFTTRSRGERGDCGLTSCVGVWREKSDLRGAPPFAPYRTLLVGPGCLKVPRNAAFSDPEGLPRLSLLRRCVILSFSPQKSIPMRHSGMCVLVHPEEEQISQANSLSGARTAPPPTPERIQG